MEVEKNGIINIFAIYVNPLLCPINFHVHGFVYSSVRSSAINCFPYKPYG